MWVYFLSFIAILCLWKLYSKVLAPYKLYNFYAKQFQAQNYRVFQYPFSVLTPHFLMQSQKDEIQHRDGYYTAKHTGHQYDAVLSNLGSRVFLVLVCPKLIQSFYQLDGTRTYVKEQQFLTILKRVANQSITFSEGEVWKAKRKFTNTFLGFSTLTSYFPTILALTNRRLAEAAQNRPQFQVYLLELLEQITSGTIIELFFGGGATDAQNLEIEGQKVSSFMRELVASLGEQMLDPLSFVLGQKFTFWGLRSRDRKVTSQVRKYIQFTENFIKNRIYEIEQGISNKEDYVYKVYHSVKKQERTPQFITRVAFQFSSLFIAGTDTTSHSAMMVVYQILMNPSVLQSLLSEIDKKIKKDQDMTYENVKNMLYLDCVVHEALRLYQPANGIFLREATEDHLLGDLRIARGTIVMTSSLSNHYNPEHFPDPLAFKPERWIGENSQLAIPHPFTWLTFSAGARSCIGKQLALMEIKIIVVQLLRKYRLTMETQDLVMKMHNLSYQPQELMTTLTAR